MNLSGEEKRIRDLFDEMRSEDERAAHTFARDWEAARARIPGRSFSFRLLRLACVTTFPIAIIVMSFVLLWQYRAGDSPTQVANGTGLAQKTPPADPELERPPQPGRPPAIVHIPPVRASKTKPVRRSRASNKQAQTVASLSAWRSPTDSLLKSPSDEMLKSLPRIGESVKEMKALLKDRMD
jgi:hypothetical protein